MTLEDHHVDRKSLRKVTGKTADWTEVAKDCVCFANGAGGRLLIGIEDGQLDPPADQRIPHELIDRTRQRVSELTVNVQLVPAIRRAANGGEYLEVIIARSTNVASTRDGRYYLRVGCTCQPVVGDDVLRLINERPGRPWESMDAHIASSDADPQKISDFCAGIRASDRVKESVKEKGPAELLAHYGLTHGQFLTHLGALLIGTAAQRRNLGTAPVVQAIKYDERGQKVNKWQWDDYSLSPIELVEVIWREIPDFRESYEIAEGMYRSNVPAYDEKVIRELLVNALVHRPYTQRGDIFLNLHPDRLEVVNPGRLPIGVTPQNILHASRRRNDGLARVFHDLALMEKEGTGFDLMYDRLLSSGRAVPIPVEGEDSVKVVIERRILRPELIQLLEDADRRFQLTQRERITLGLLAQSEGLTARELSGRLELAGDAPLKPWLGRLLDFELIGTTGRTAAMKYFASPDLLKQAGMDGRTTLARIQPHRLRALICEDLERYPSSSSTDINRRIGAEISAKTLKRALDELVREGKVRFEGERRWRKYWFVAEAAKGQDGR